MGNDSAIALGKLVGFGDKYFRHSARLQPRIAEKYGIEPHSRATKRLRESRKQGCSHAHCLKVWHPARSAAHREGRMDSAAILVATAGAFALAGFVKGVIGLGLPTVSIGLLGLLMAPAQAAAILVVPSLVTNIWQAAVGGGLIALARRLWPMLAGICIGTIIGAALLPHDDSGRATVWLGVLLVLYAAFGFVKGHFAVPRHAETWLGLLVGAATGALTVATGIFVIPGTPYIQSLKFDRDKLVQALGLSFTVSTITLALALAYAGQMRTSLAWPSIVALAAALAGMGLGQLIRGWVKEGTFRLCFFSGLFLLGAHLALRGLL
jgi:uncharacterized membrane protein YfcA